MSNHDTTEEHWEDEGGAWYMECATCHKQRKEYKDDLCIFCWLKREAQKDGPIFDKG